MPFQSTITLAFALSALTLLALAAGSGAAETPKGITVSPSKIDQRVKLGSFLDPIYVANSSGSEVRVEVQPLPARQGLNGLPVYTLTAANRKIGDQLFAVSPKSFVLKSGTRRSVRVKVLACPQSGLGTYGVVTFTASKGQKTRASVVPGLRLSSTLLLRNPATACLDGEIVRIRAEETGGRLAFFTAVRNLGNLHFKPRLKLIITKNDKRIATGNFQSANVIPDAVREYGLTLKKDLSAGGYQAMVKLQAGRKISSESQSFRLTDTNKLPTPALKITSLKVSNTEPSDSPQVKVILENSGSAAAKARIRLALAKIGASSALESRTLSGGKIEPGGSAKVQTRFSPPAIGQYQVRATLLSEGRAVDQRTVTFELKRGPSFIERATNWLAEHVVTVVLVLLLALIAAMVAALLYIRALRRA